MKKQAQLMQWSTMGNQPHHYRIKCDEWKKKLKTSRLLWIYRHIYWPVCEPITSVPDGGDKDNLRILDFYYVLISLQSPSELQILHVTSHQLSLQKLSTTSRKQRKEREKYVLPYFVSTILLLWKCQFLILFHDHNYIDRIRTIRITLPVVLQNNHEYRDIGIYLCHLAQSWTYLATDSAHRTFSDARPPTRRFANWIVALVASASCWQRSFSAVACSKSAVNFASCSSKDCKLVDKISFRYWQ
jgi:hypothetical protein